MKAQRGFTLVELLVAVAIVAILASMALPAYSDYVKRSKIPDATSNLSTYRVRMEQYFQDNLRYTVSTASAACGVTMPQSSYFTYTCTATQPTDPATPNTYTITATSPGTKGNAMDGFTYTVNQNNTRTSAIVATTSQSNSGWIATSSTCWITKKGGQC